MWITSDTVVQAGIKGLRRKKIVLVPGRVYRSVRPFMNSRAAQRIMPVVIGNDDKYVGLFHFDLPCLHASAGFQSMPCACRNA